MASPRSGCRRKPAPESICCARRFWKLSVPRKAPTTPSWHASATCARLARLESTLRSRRRTSRPAPLPRSSFALRSCARLMTHSAKSPARTPPMICWGRSSVVFASGNNHAVSILVRDRLSRPIENDLAALTREHRRKRGFKFFGGIVVGDDRRQVEAALNHRHHFVPGLEHLAPVDALDLKALEYDLVPVDSHPRRRNAEQCDLAAVIHVQKQALECLRHTGHFHSDVEAFGHAQFVHDVAQVLPLDVDRAGRAHAPGEIEAVVVDV